MQNIDALNGLKILDELKPKAKVFETKPTTQKQTSFSFYLDGVLLPVAPGKLSTKINGKNKTISLINDGEINLLHYPGLTDLQFTFLLPHTQYPFARYENGVFQPPYYYLEKVEDWCKNKTPISFVVLRRLVNINLYDTNILVSVEDYQINEDAKELGFDTEVQIKLKQYADYYTKEIDLYQETQVNGSTVTMGVEVKHRIRDNTTVNSYTVQPGDALYTIAKAVYGDGELWMMIYNANKDLIDNNNIEGEQPQYTIHPGQVLVMP